MYIWKDIEMRLKVFIAITVLHSLTHPNTCHKSFL